MNISVHIFVFSFYRSGIWQVKEPHIYIYTYIYLYTYIYICEILETVKAVISLLIQSAKFSKILANKISVCLLSCDC